MRTVVSGRDRLLAAYVASRRRVADLIAVEQTAKQSPSQKRLQPLGRVIAPWSCGITYGRFELRRLAMLTFDNWWSTSNPTYGRRHKIGVQSRWKG